MRWLVTKILFSFYHLIVSPVFHTLLGPHFGCRFEPTCSHYAAEALQIHGVFKGLFLTIGRILRCQPFARAGYDPVPHAIEMTCFNINSGQRR